MFNNLKKYKKIIVGAIILVALFVAYNTFFAGGADELLVSESIGGVSNAVGQDLLATLLQIKSIKLDDRVFSDVGLESLEDFTQEVLPQQVGRPNPFLPIGINPEQPESTQIIEDDDSASTTPETTEPEGSN